MSIDKILRPEVKITKDVIAQYIPIFCGFINTFVGIDFCGYDGHHNFNDTCSITLIRVI